MAPSVQIPRRTVVTGATQAGAPSIGGVS
jgi:hypothetical protein